MHRGKSEVSEIRNHKGSVAMKPKRVALTQRKLLSVLISSVLIISSLLLACKQKIRKPQEPGKTIYLDAKSDWQDTGLKWLGVKA